MRSGDSAGARPSEGLGGDLQAGGDEMTQAEAQAARQQMEQEQRRIMLRAVLTPEAQERLHRIQLVKPARARELEGLILRTAGRFGGRIDEPTLIELLQSHESSTASSHQPKVTRMRRFSDDDDDDDC
ncbi:programmed cell death 5 protein [Cystoisospora suis]|uniref:Programmed cell death 5 protein n=1 Tax=Cystoisospora suis TaxID=483139 RepID=A0A2C6LFJ0_9APIC|nr:programmed cell death 5 protein [Cystoisospora suis]